VGILTREQLARLPLALTYGLPHQLFREDIGFPPSRCLPKQHSTFSGTATFSSQHLRWLGPDGVRITRSLGSEATNLCENSSNRVPTQQVLRSLLAGVQSGSKQNESRLKQHSGLRVQLRLLIWYRKTQVTRSSLYQDGNSTGIQWLTPKAKVQIQTIGTIPDLLTIHSRD